MEDREKDAPVEETVVMNTGDDTSPTADTGDGAAEAESERKKAPGAKTVAIAAAVALALAAACGVAAMGASQAQQPASEQEERAVEEETDSSDDEAATVEVGIAETADAMDGSTSPTIVHFKGTSGDAEGVDFYHATAAEEAMLGTDSVELAEGSYEVEFLPTVNSDGSINEGTGDNPQDLTIDASDGMERVVAVDSETTAADKVTADQIADVQKATAEAVAKGDGTLTGEAGEKVAEKVAENASKAPAAGKEKVEEAKQEATEAAGKESSAKTDTNGTASQASQKADSGKTSSSSSSTTVKKDSTVSSNKGTSGSSNSSSQSGSSSKKEHTHTWVAVTHEEPVYSEQPVYETRTKTVVDQEAYTEYVDYVLFNDGAKFYDYSSANEYRHSNPRVGWSNGTDSVYHPAVTHEESYQVQTGTQKVQAGTKTVTDGYKCSGCGATK